MMEMEVTTPRLTESQARFRDLLEQVSYLQPYWTWDGAEPQCQIDDIQSAMDAWSHGERIMAQFMVGLWGHTNKFEFDLFEAAGTLDEANRKIISDWIKDPFWP